MKTFKWMLTAGFVMWGISSLSAAPLTQLPVRISMALPAQAVDFSDLDLRDENNRPISAPSLRRRFEDALNENLNRLLIDNLTPLRRAWLAIVNQGHDVFADWIGAARQTGQRFVWTVTERSAKAAAALRSWIVRLAPTTIRLKASPGEQFLSLLSPLIASTRLLR